MPGLADKKARQEARAKCREKGEYLIQDVMSAVGRLVEGRLDEDFLPKIETKLKKAREWIEFSDAGPARCLEISDELMHLHTKVPMEGTSWSKDLRGILWQGVEAFLQLAAKK